jgi:hypothetical protein
MPINLGWLWHPIRRGDRVLRKDHEGGGAWPRRGAIRVSPQWVQLLFMVYSCRQAAYEIGAALSDPRYSVSSPYMRMYRPLTSIPTNRCWKAMHKR